jgi:glyceraldehyde-3-phosphate dehydrogenase/erythrose-4-phosphate dehydrogenase
MTSIAINGLGRIGRAALKVMSWYDNEGGSTCQMREAFTALGLAAPELTQVRP